MSPPLLPRPLHCALRRPMSYNRRKKPNFPTSPQFTFPSFQSRPLTHTSSLSRRTGPEFQTKILSSSVLFLRFQNSRFLTEVACISDFPYGTDKTHGICRSAFEAFISLSLSLKTAHNANWTDFDRLSVWPKPPPRRRHLLHAWQWQWRDMCVLCSH